MSIRNIKKKRRQQPRPKRKKQNHQVLKQKSSSELNTYIKNAGKQLVEMFKNKDKIVALLNDNINIIEYYFRKYDTIQLLGSIGLYLLENLPNPEKSFYAQSSGIGLDLDENAEVLAEYALNFGLAIPNTNKENPTDAIVEDLRNRLRILFFTYIHLDMPLENDSLKMLEWLIHMDTIAIRGDGYQTHVYEVFKEMFIPHSDFYIKEYGYNIEQLFNFFIELEDRVICKIANQNFLYGTKKMHDRLLKWEETYGKAGDLILGRKHDASKGIFGDFVNANPDVPHSEDYNHLIAYETSDYTKSDIIFWVYPQNEVERNILNSLSMEFGDNSSFLDEGEYKGNIMNGHSIFEKPFVKNGEKFYCFTPMIPHRNLFLIAEKLMKRNDAYYQKNFQQNSSYISRDAYIERKAREVLDSFLQNVKFYSSLSYTVNNNGVSKNTELDILGISDKANYVIEVKAHELSRKDRVGLEGAKFKFKVSVAEACSQCNRAYGYIKQNDIPKFGSKLGEISIDKSKPTYKIVVTFQHYYALLGQMDKLIESGLMKEEYRDTWIVSLFDLMVVSEFIENEDEFLAYLNMHKIINTNHSTFQDELDLLGQFLNFDLAKKVQPNKPIWIYGGTEDIDVEYSKEYYLPINHKN